MMFALTTNLASFDSKNFKVDNVTNMLILFVMCSKLSNISALSNWNVENVTYMSYMFYGCTNLQDASGINDWDIRKVTNFTNMFRNVPSHPEFTKVSGSWDSNGTFTPNA